MNTPTEHTKSYHPAKLVELAELANRLAVALEKSRGNPHGAWPIVCVECATKIERVRNPWSLAFLDVGRQCMGAQGFESVAAVEDIYDAHDRFLVASGWQRICADAEGHDWAEELTPSLSDDPEHVERLRGAGECLKKLAVTMREPKRQYSEVQHMILEELQREEPQTAMQLVGNLAVCRDTLFGKRGKGGLTELKNWGDVNHSKAAGGYTLSESRRKQT